MEAVLHTMKSDPVVKALSPIFEKNMGLTDIGKK
jgi:hypothetical protein